MNGAAFHRRASQESKAEIVHAQINRHHPGTYRGRFYRRLLAGWLSAFQWDHLPLSLFQPQFFLGRLGQLKFWQLWRIIARGIIDIRRFWILRQFTCLGGSLNMERLPSSPRPDW